MSDDIDNLTNMFIAMQPGVIEAQEVRGQRSFVSAERMPVRLRPGRDVYERLGFVFGRVLDGRDEVFQEARLPTGWTKKAASHSMWSKLIDEQGRVRGSVFFKAAFYDYKAHAYLHTRYCVEEKCGAGPDCADITIVADRGVRLEPRHGDEEPFVDVHVFGSSKAGDYAAERALRAAAQAWIAEHYPDHADVTAYW